MPRAAQLPFPCQRHHVKGIDSDNDSVFPTLSSTKPHPVLRRRVPAVETRPVTPHSSQTARLGTRNTRTVELLHHRSTQLAAPPNRSPTTTPVNGRVPEQWEVGKPFLLELLGRRRLHYPDQPVTAAQCLQAALALERFSHGDTGSTRPATTPIIDSPLVREPTLQDSATRCAPRRVWPLPERRPRQAQRPAERTTGPDHPPCFHTGGRLHIHPRPRTTTKDEPDQEFDCPLNAWDKLHACPAARLMEELDAAIAFPIINHGGDSMEMHQGPGDHQRHFHDGLRAHFPAVSFPRSVGYDQDELPYLDQRPLRPG